MSDLIDREALLRQIDIDSEGEPGYYGDTWKFIDTIKRMPSALGTNLAEVGTDCISRQAAIDAVNSRKNAEQCKEGEVRNWTVDACVDMIKQLPSAQPERIKGRWISADAIFGGEPFYCSECGENTRDTVMGKPRWKFCPMCGAKMEVNNESN